MKRKALLILVLLLTTAFLFAGGKKEVTHSSAPVDSHTHTFVRDDVKTSHWAQALVGSRYESSWVNGAWVQTQVFIYEKDSLELISHKNKSYKNAFENTDR